MIRYHYLLLEYDDYGYESWDRGFKRLRFITLFFCQEIIEYSIRNLLADDRNKADNRKGQYKSISGNS